MALVYFLVLVIFCLTSWWVIRWFLNRYFSSKPWHRWVRYAVWLGCIVLLTFDSFYYQVVVVHGMCEADKKRVYPTPPASLVVGGPYMSEDAIRSANLKNTYRWSCQEKLTYLKGICLINGVSTYNQDELLPFGSRVSRFIIRDNKTNQIYRVWFQYEQAGQWLTRKIFGFGFVWVKQPSKCEEGFWSPEFSILLD